MDLLNQYKDSDDSCDSVVKDYHVTLEAPQSGDKHDDVTQETAALTAEDYFGLGDSESDSDISHAVSSAKSASSEVLQKHLKRTLPASPKNQKSDECLEHGTVLPDSDFWKGENEEDIYWDDPNKIWKSKFKFKDTMTSKRRTSHEYQTEFTEEDTISAKKLKPNESVLHYESKPLSISCFNVHKRIAPYLNEGLTRTSIPKKSESLQGHSGAINNIKWCSSQYSHLLLTCSMDATVKIWNVFTTSTSDKCVQVFPQHSKAVKDAVWTTDGKNVLSCGYDKTVRLLDVVKGEEITCQTYDSFVTSLAFHPVSPSVFVAGSLNSIAIGDSRCSDGLVKKYTYKHTFGQVQDIAFVEDGSEFFSCADHVSKESSDRNIMAWDFRTGVVVSNQIYQERYTCTRLKLHPQHKVLAAQTNGNYVALFSTIRPYKMDKYKRFEGHKVLGYKVGCDFSRDGQILASGSSDGYVYYYDYRTSTLIKKTSINNEVCLDVSWHPVLPNMMAVSTWSGNIYVLS